MLFGQLRFFTKRELYNLWNEQKEENERLKKEISELRAISGYKIETQHNLAPCDRPECKACVYATRYRDKEGGYAMLCTKGAECKDFAPWKDA